ncbi:MAG: isochorismate synthase [Cyanobacteria bacterium J06638_38]
MKIITWMQSIVKYLFNGVSRLFKPTDDDYPKTGVQPFSGDPSDESEEYS